MRYLLILCTVLGIASACPSAHAKEPDPPAVMQPLHAAQLDAAMAHLQEAQEAIDRINKEKEPYTRTAVDILKRYKINPEEFGRNVTVDFATGKITRKPATSSTKLTPPAPPPPAKKSHG